VSSGKDYFQDILPLGPIGRPSGTVTALKGCSGTSRLQLTQHYPFRFVECIVSRDTYLLSFNFGNLFVCRSLLCLSLIAVGTTAFNSNA
jgi:hypothetical protein